MTKPAIRPQPTRFDFPSLLLLVCFASAMLGGYWVAAAQFEPWEPESPATSGSHTRLAKYYEDRGDTETAIDEYRRALVGDPQSLVASYNLASLYVRTKQSAQAIAQLERTVALDPEFVLARANLGIELARAGRLEEAVRQLRAARSHPAARESLRVVEAALAAEQAAKKKKLANPPAAGEVPPTATDSESSNNRQPSDDPPPSEDLPSEPRLKLDPG